MQVKFVLTVVLIFRHYTGILKAKQKLGVTFNFDKLGSIDFITFSKLTMCRTSEG